MSHLIGKKRKFGNDTFTAQASRMKKKDAEKYAENKRKQGFKARIVEAKHPKKGKEFYIFLKKGKAKKKTAKQKHKYGGHGPMHYPEHYEEEPMPRMRRTEIFDDDSHPMPQRPMPMPSHPYYRKKKTTKKKTTKKKPVKRKTVKKKPVKRKTTKKKTVKRKPVKRKTTKKKTVKRKKK